MTYKYTHEYNGYHFGITVEHTVIMNDQAYHNIVVVGNTDNQYDKKYYDIPTTELNRTVAIAKFDAQQYIDNFNGAKQMGIIDKILTKLGFHKD